MKVFLISRCLLHICFILLVMIHTHSASAQDRNGFLKTELQELENRVREKHDPQSIARSLSETHSLEGLKKEPDTPFKLYIAIRWFEQKHHHEAEVLLDTVRPTEEHPDLWLYYRATLLIYRGAINEALPLVARLEGKHPRDNDVLYLKGLYLTETGDLKGALALMDKIIRQNKREGRFYLQRGAMQMLVFSYDAALKDYKSALRYLKNDDIPARQQACFQIGLIYWKVKLDEARGEEFLARGLKLDPHSEMVGQVRRALEQ